MVNRVVLFLLLLLLSLSKTVGNCIIWRPNPPKPNSSSASTTYAYLNIFSPASHTCMLTCGHLRGVVLQKVNSQDADNFNVAALAVLDEQSGNFTFSKFVNGPFGSSKFLVRRDTSPSPPSLPASVPAAAAAPLYFGLSTNITSATANYSNYNARNNLVLSISHDLEAWHVCATIASDDTGLAPLDSIAYTGFEYPDFIYDGNDILAVIRTAYRGAADCGASNRVTFKRIVGYRSLCGL